MAKIENLCVDIKVGKKEYSIKNLILDELLKVYASALVDDYKTQRKYLKHCFIKFDTPIENITESSELKNTDFDIAILCDRSTTEYSPNQIVNKYNWSNYIYNFHTAPISWSEYAGRKICTIGFGFNFMASSTYNMCAVLDVTNYDIYVEENEEVYITRIDKISTDAIFTSSNDELIKGPIHLQGGIALNPTESAVKNVYAKLTNLGLSNKVDEIQRELDLDYEVNGNIFTINNLYSPSGLYPSENLYPSEDLYLDDEPYKYLVLKFTLYNSNDVDTGEYYLQAIPLENRGDIKLNIKYERG